MISNKCGFPSYSNIWDPTFLIPKCLELWLLSSGSPKLNNSHAKANKENFKDPANKRTLLTDQ